MIYEPEKTEELMSKFNICVRYVKVQPRQSDTLKLLILGGIEVIATVSDDDDMRRVFNDVGKNYEYMICEDNQRLSYKYVDIPFKASKLKELLVHREINVYSKEDALKLNSDIKSKEELEDDIVYITDKQPMTNTLALAKQFNLEHKHIVDKLYELGSMYPSVLMQMKYNVYSDTSKTGGKGRKPKVVGSSSVTEYSVTVKTKETYQSFIHISEDVYYQFVKKISTPKGITSSDLEKRNKAMAKLVHIESKQDEYFNAFKRVRDFLLESGTSSKELEAIIRKRTFGTLELMKSTYNFTKRHNSYKDNKKLNLINVNKFIFNLVNYVNNINAVNYTPPTEEELKSNRTRLTKDEELQQGIILLEGKLISALTLGASLDVTLHTLIKHVFSFTDDDIHKILKEYDAEYLWDETKSYNY